MKVLLAAMLLSGMLAGCTNSNKQTTDNDMEQELTLTQEWDKVFPLSEKVNHQKVTFMTQYGLTLAADLYTPASPDPSKERGEKLPAIAVSGPFGAVKEQCSGLYAMKMAERGFVALAFDPSYTGESSGEPRRTASPDINTEDFMAAVDFLSKQDNVDTERIGIIGICGWGGIALNAAAAEGYKFVGEPNPNPENKQLLIIPDASHCDLYDGGYEEKAGKGQPKNMIPWDTLAEFFTKNME